MPSDPSSTGISRRRFAKAGLALSATAGFGLPAPAIAQGATLRYTLSWVPAGGSAYIYVARQLGVWKRRCIEVEISRGYGSLAAIQAVSQRRFDIGNAGTGVAILSLLKGLDIKLVNISSYDAGIGIIVPESSAIKTPADLAGHTVGATAAGSDTPFLAPYFKRVGLPDGSVTITYLDPQIIEQAVISGRVDAQVAVATSSVPAYVTQGVAFRFFPVAAQGLGTYGGGAVASSAFVAENPALAADFSDGLLEGLKFALLNPEETQERFLREHEEIAISPNAKRFASLGIGMGAASAIAPEAVEHSLGYADFAKLDEQAALIRDVFGKPGDKQPPPAASYAGFGLTDHIKLSAAEWQTARDKAAPFAGYLGRTV